ncbi:hypothetical protein N9P58_01890 [Puniceicoccaceae bacterium]|nr:hypothetical protein [Puniceicoccaceae bacterium]
MKNLIIDREFYDNLAKVGSLSIYYEPKCFHYSIQYKDGQDTDKDAEDYLCKYHFEFLDKVRSQENLDIFNEGGVLSIHDAEAKVLAFEAHEGPLEEIISDEVNSEIQNLVEKIFDDVKRLNPEISDLDDVLIYYTDENGEESCNLGTLITDDELEDDIRSGCSYIDFGTYKYGTTTYYCVEIDESRLSGLSIRWLELFKAQLD